MIDFLEGVLSEKSPEGAVIDVGGVGFFLSLSSSTLQGLPATGKKARLFTYLHVKEDALHLYGFRDRRERDLFLKLIAVTGIGPRAAMAVLSAYDAEAFVRIVATEDLESLTAISGVGKKSGQRIILELKDKLAPLAEGLEGVAAGPDGAGLAREAREALKELGYSAAEASRALEGYSSEAPSLEEMVRHALKRLGGTR